MIEATDVKSIQRKCLERRLEVVEAVDQIDEAIGGIKSVIFKQGMKFKITNYDVMFSLDFQTRRRKELELLHGLVVVAYFRAQENGSITPGEVHISKEASTKHHVDGIYAILKKYQV